MSTGADSSGARRHRGPEPLLLGPLILARSAAGVEAEGRDHGFGQEFVTLYVPAGLGDGTPPRRRASSAAGPSPAITLLAPRRFIGPAFPAGAETRATLPRSPGVDLLHRYLDGLLTVGVAHFCERQKLLTATAVKALLAAALAPEDTGDAGGLRSRRREALMDRLAAYIDAHLHDELGVETLCAGVGCSRSALYRATAGAGGAAELVMRRRLLAIRERLQTGDDQRSVAAIAADYRFSDLAQLNRRFKAMFGVSPGAARARPPGAVRTTPQPHGRAAARPHARRVASCR